MRIRATPAVSSARRSSRSTASVTATRRTIASSSRPSCSLFVRSAAQKRAYATSSNAAPKSTSSHKIALINGDGIGKEIVPEAERFLKSVEKSLKVPLSFITLKAGWETFKETGKALPDETLAALRTCNGAIFGAVSSPSGPVKGYSSPIVAMRNALDLYANIRPSESAPIESSRQGVDLLIVRENTECLYVKRERVEDDGKKVIAERVITEYATERIARVAYEQARKRQSARESQKSSSSSRKSRVTIVHKANVLSQSDGLFRRVALQVSKEFPDVQTEEQLVDSMVYKMILDPTYYDVIVAPNMYGDILSDAAAALVGGLGLAPSANVGKNMVMVEPVHGSAPDIEGKGVCNPIATLRAVALLLDTLGEDKVSKALLQACFNSLKSGPRTPDLGGKGKTKEVTDNVIEHTLKLLKSN